MTFQALPATCQGCNKVILESNFDYCARVGTGLMRADLTALTPELEAACIILARPVYNLHKSRNQHHLSLRDHHWHRFHTAGHPRAALPAHRCGRDLPGTLIDIEPAARESGSDTSPF